MEGLFFNWNDGADEWVALANLEVTSVERGHD
ncbi:MAG: hypothetical protein RLZZ232_1408 [Planctomycetota bacterium]|jgi:hypothetical protein